MDNLIEVRNTRGRYAPFGKMKMRVERTRFNFTIGQDVCDEKMLNKGCMFRFNMKQSYAYIYAEQGYDVFEPVKKVDSNYSRFRSKILFGYFEQCFGAIVDSADFDIIKSDDILGNYKITRKEVTDVL